MFSNWSQGKPGYEDFSFSSEAPGLVLSATYLRPARRGSALSRKRNLRFPPLISREKTAPSHQSLQKSPHIPSNNQMEEPCEHLPCLSW